MFVLIPFSARTVLTNLSNKWSTKGKLYNKAHKERENNCNYCDNGFVKGRKCRYCSGTTNSHW